MQSHALFLPFQTVLEATGYGFAVGKWTPWFIRWIAREGLKGPPLHRAFLEHTREFSFRQEIEDLFQRSRHLRRRWNVVRAGYEAHVQREYIVSIPVLLPQLEGVVTDLMILRNQAMKVGRKVIARGSDGRPKQNSRGSPLVLSGPDAKLTHSGYKDDDEIRAAAKFILDALIQPRNAILHGRWARYGRAKLSVQILFLLWIYAAVVVAVEDGQISQT